MNKKLLYNILIIITSYSFASEILQKTIPSDSDSNAIEITNSFYINGNLSVGGTISPSTGGGLINFGSAKNFTYFFPAQVIINRNSTNIDSKFSNVYTSNGRPVGTWSIAPSGTTQRYLSVSFGIPTTINLTVNPTVDMFIAVQSFNDLLQVINLAVDADYIISGAEMGSSLPATGIKQTVTSGNLTIVEPLGNNNLKIYKVTVTLNPLLITAGCLCNLFFYRVAPTSGTEYKDNVYLVAVNFNFSVT